MEGRSITSIEDFKQQYDENISSSLVSSMESLRALLQLLNSPGFEDWGNEFLEQNRDEMKKDLEEDEGKAQVLLGVMEYLIRIIQDDEVDWIERKKEELEEFLSVIEDLTELLDEDEDY